MKLSRNTFIILLIVFNIAIDQISKFWVKANVEFESVTELLGSFLTLRHVLNEGAFLGMGSDLNDNVKLFVLLVLPTLVLGLVVLHIFRDKTLDKLSLIGFSCVVGGGVANIYDRFVYGHVVDFFHIDLGFVQTGIFNVADMSVTTGMILILWSALKHKKKKKTQETL